jgi:hypothetical protein
VISHKVTQEWTNQGLNSYQLHCPLSISRWRDGKSLEDPKRRLKERCMEAVIISKRGYALKRREGLIFRAAMAMEIMVVYNLKIMKDGGDF